LAHQVLPFKTPKNLQQLFYLGVNDAITMLNDELANLLGSHQILLELLKSPQNFTDVNLGRVHIIQNSSTCALISFFRFLLTLEIFVQIGVVRAKHLESFRLFGCGVCIVQI